MIWLTHDSVLDEELFFEIFANLLSGHDERVADSRSKRRVGVIEPGHKRAGGGKPVRGICNTRREWPAGKYRLSGRDSGPHGGIRTFVRCNAGRVNVLSEL